MIVRPYEERDLEQIVAIHEARKDGTWLQDPRSPLAGPRVVAEKDGKIIGAAVGRRTLEAFLEISPNYKGAVRRARLVVALLRAGAAQARELGYEEWHQPVSDPAFHRYLLTLPGVHEDKRLWSWFDLVGTKD